jgi:PhnB protein
MESRLIPYLSFNGNAREAMDFYLAVFGGRVERSTFKEFGLAENSDDEDKIMHSMLETDNGLTFMAADFPHSMKFDPGMRITLSLSGDDEEELRGYWNKLTDGGKITEPLEKAPWGDTFGMLTDKFGIDWMVNIAGQPAK